MNDRNVLSCWSIFPKTVPIFYPKDLEIIPKDLKIKRENVARVWKDYTNAYDIGPQTWIKECLKMYEVS